MMAAGNQSAKARKTWIRSVALLGLCAVAVAVGIVFEPARGWPGVLTAAVYGISIAMGVILFATINVAAGARWWHPLRPICVELSRTIVVPAVLILVVLGLGVTSLYPWAASGAMEGHLHAKEAWLNVPFFIARGSLILLVWLAIVYFLGRGLNAVVQQPSAEATRRLLSTSALSIVLLAITISVAFWDWTMSLEPEWFSTVYGVYGFAGALQGGIAVVAVSAIHMARREGQTVAPNVLHDLGKLLFAFSMFWAYIWFCQYMLIWYANLPEETSHYIVRFSHGWSMLFWLNPLINFGVPFFVLMSADTKKSPSVLLHVSLVILVGRWLDIYLLIGPATASASSVPIYAIIATFGVLIGMGIVFFRTHR
jgi:hypothetical protein